MTDEQHQWACAHIVLQRHGDGAPLFVAERIGALLVSGDDHGVAMWKAIAIKIDKLRNPTGYFH